MPRASILLAFAAVALAGLAGCGKDGPDDPAVATPGVGIPLGAVGATGVAFDAPTSLPLPAPKTKSGKPGKPPIGLGPGEPMPPDPFESPPEDVDPTPAPPPKGKAPPAAKPHSPSETTL